MASSPEPQMVKQDEPPPLKGQQAKQPRDDPDYWPPHAVQWYRKVFYSRDVVYFVFYVAAFASYFLNTTPMTKLMNPKGMIIPAFVRVVLTVLFAVIALVTLWIDLAWSTAPEPHDRKWNLLINGFGGHFSYLTVNILTTWAVYWPLCALAEVAWYLSLEQVWVAQAITATYRFAVLSSTLGIVLTLLFLKFNWYEPAWRRDVLQMYEARGKQNFRFKVLFTHVNQLPIALFDVIVLKQNHGGLFAAVTPPIRSLLQICVAYCFVYLCFTRVNHRINGGVYPYPFMDKLFASWTSEFAFFLGLLMFVFGICFCLHFIAVEAWLEEKVLFGD